MLRQIHDEIARFRGPLADWTRRPDVKSALILAEATDHQRVQDVITRGYAPNLTDVDLEKIGRDPFLIAAAMGRGGDRVVVTREVSRPNAMGANRKIPDVCRVLGVPVINDYTLYRNLGFSTR